MFNNGYVIINATFLMMIFSRFSQFLLIISMASGTDLVPIMSNNGKQHIDRCCNPYENVGVMGHKGKDLRYLSQNLKRKFPDLPNNVKICWACRHEKHKCRSKSADSQLSNLSSVSQIDIALDENKFSIHDFASSCEVNEVIVRSQREIELEDMLRALKEKFSTLQINDPLRLSILTIVPEAWSVSKIAKEFNCSRRIAKKAKNLRASRGVLAETTAKTGTPLPQSTVEKVKDFYSNDSNSRIMPGKKNVISVRTNESRCLIQKRLLLLDLRGLYQTYKESHSDFPVSFSKFAQLRPKHCVLAGASGTHSICVCTIHQNCKLMLDAIDIRQLTKGLENPISDYKDCLQQITCKSSNVNCFLGDCDKCPKIETFLQHLQQLLEEKNIDDVQFSAWTGTDRSTLQTQIFPAMDFLEHLCDKLLILKPHSFIAKQQSQFFEDKKKNLGTEEVLVVLDFSENYKYVVQDASQAFHFNNTQCTIFPVVYYYKDSSELKHKSLVFLSDSTRHDTAAVYTVQKLLIPHMKESLCVKNIIYFSDGAKQHFKNKFQMVNLIHHDEDFGVKAEWHVHATAHGKGASDGVGALFKREAARNSLLRKPTEAILSLDKLVNWGQQHFTNITTLFYSEKEHEEISKFLRSRFDKAPSVPQILKSHCFIVNNNRTLLIKRYSNASNGVELLYKV